MQEEVLKFGETILKANSYISAPCVLKALFSPAECAEILRLGKGMPAIQGKVVYGNDQSLAETIRKSELRWFTAGAETEWVFARFANTIGEVNKHYRFQLSGIKDLQLAQYSAGGFFDWHVDLGVGLTSTRKLSLSVQLSRASDYEGGQLEFLRQNDSSQQGNDIGDVIIFPSFLPHRVTPVTKGSRYSLVAWAVGHPFH